MFVIDLVLFEMMISHTTTASTCCRLPCALSVPFDQFTHVRALQASAACYLTRGLLSYPITPWVIFHCDVTAKLAQLYILIVSRLSFQFCNSEIRHHTAYILIGQYIRIYDTVLKTCLSVRLFVKPMFAPLHCSDWELWGDLLIATRFRCCRSIDLRSVVTISYLTFRLQICISWCRRYVHSSRSVTRRWSAVSSGKDWSIL